MSKDLTRLLNPRSIALLGGSWSENVIIQLQKSGYSGEIWPVHPIRDEICGLACFQSLSELPSPPDACFIGINRELTIGAVEELAKMGAGGATCFASGFLESEAEGSGGGDLQDRLIKAAGDMPIIGPNCYGLINYLDNVTLWPDQHGGRPCDRGVGIIGQSSNILINITMQTRSLPIAYCLAAGNQAQISMSDMANQLLDDERITAIGLYIEGFSDLQAFEQMAEKAKTMGKPIVAIKAGKSEKSRAATMSHTASLAGTAAASSAFLERLGILEVESVSVFIETLKLLHQFGPLQGNAISSTSCSGGEVGLVSDLADNTEIHFRELSPKAHAKLKEVLGPIVTVSNPLDYHTFIWANAEALLKTYRAMFEDGFDLSVIIMDIPNLSRCDMSDWEVPLKAAIEAARQSSGQVAFATILPENLPEEIADRLFAEGIVPLHGVENMVLAVDAAIRAGKMTRTSHEPVLIGVELKQDRRILDESESKAVLAKYGISFPKSVVGKNAPEIASAAKKALEFPIALKGLGIAHKTEAGAVKLGLHSDVEVETAAAAMEAVSGYLAEEMVSDAVAELIVGVVRDPTGLFLLTIGAGGVLTEIMQDTVSLLLPTTGAEIDNALSELKINNLLIGYRGKPKADRNAIINAILSIQAYCMENPELLELDINPLMARPKGATAVDALITKET